MRRFGLLAAVYCGVVGLALPASAGGPPPPPTIDFAGLAQLASNNIISALSAAAPFIFTIFAAIVAVAVIMRVVKTVTGG